MSYGVDRTELHRMAVEVCIEWIEDKFHSGYKYSWVERIAKEMNNYGGWPVNVPLQSDDPSIESRAQHRVHLTDVEIAWAVDQGWDRQGNP